jgi:sugar/nucleoside kinase (ribokinase family)
VKSILTIGEILVEIMATERGDGFLEPITLLGPFPSGAPAIFIDQAARFGQPAAIIACVGDDDFGRVNLNRFRRGGVDVSGVRIDREVATGSAFVPYQQRTDLAPSFSTSGTALRGALRSTLQCKPWKCRANPWTRKSCQCGWTSWWS